METVFFTGFMGAGKTTIGKALAERVGVKLVDLDEFIEKKYNKTIREIFEEEGEKTFRKYEHEALLQLIDFNGIVTTGGGVVTSENNRQLMRKNGLIIYLDCSVDEILSRLKQDTTRPLLDGNKEEQVRSLYQERQVKYREADYIVSTSGKSIKEIVSEIINRASKSIEDWK
jgi:shikimate kinase